MNESKLVSYWLFIVADIKCSNTEQLIPRIFSGHNKYILFVGRGNFMTELNEFVDTAAKEISALPLSGSWAGCAVEGS